jgi:hypothetical protein
MEEGGIEIYWLSFLMFLDDSMDCFSLPVGPHPQNGYSPLLREEDLKFVYYVYACFSFVMFFVFVFFFSILST